MFSTYWSFYFMLHNAIIGLGQRSLQQVVYISYYTQLIIIVLETIVKRQEASKQRYIAKNSSKVHVLSEIWSNIIPTLGSRYGGIKRRTNEHHHVVDTRGGIQGIIIIFDREGGHLREATAYSKASLAHQKPHLVLQGDFHLFAYAYKLQAYMLDNIV